MESDPDYTKGVNQKDSQKSESPVPRTATKESGVPTAFPGTGKQDSDGCIEEFGETPMIHASKLAGPVSASEVRKCVVAFLMGWLIGSNPELLLILF